MTNFPPHAHEHQDDTDPTSFRDLRDKVASMLEARFDTRVAYGFNPEDPVEQLRNDRDIPLELVADAIEMLRRVAYASPTNSHRAAFALFIADHYPPIDDTTPQLEITGVQLLNPDAESFATHTAIELLWADDTKESIKLFFVNDEVVHSRYTKRSAQELMFFKRLYTLFGPSRYPDLLNDLRIYGQGYDPETLAALDTYLESKVITTVAAHNQQDARTLLAPIRQFIHETKDALRQVSTPSSSQIQQTMELLAKLASTPRPN